MQQAISTQELRNFTNIYTSSRKQGLLTRFFNWCDGQEKNRFLWLGISLFGSIATILPLTLIAIVFLAGNNFTLWAIACTVNVPVLIVNLAAQPVKYVLPVMFSAWALDILIIAFCAVTFFGNF